MEKETIITTHGQRVIGIGTEYDMQLNTEGAKVMFVPSDYDRIVTNSVCHFAHSAYGFGKLVIDKSINPESSQLPQIKYQNKSYIGCIGANSIDWLEMTCDLEKTDVPANLPLQRYSGR